MVYWVSPPKAVVQLNNSWLMLNTFWFFFSCRLSLCSIYLTGDIRHFNSLLSPSHWLNNDKQSKLNLFLYQAAGITCHQLQKLVRVWPLIGDTRTAILVMAVSGVAIYIKTRRYDSDRVQLMQRVRDHPLQSRPPARLRRRHRRCSGRRPRGSD